MITNSIPVLHTLAGCPGIALVASGGTVQHPTRSLVGDDAAHTFRALRADKVFIGASGVSPTFGISNTNLAEAEVKRAMIAAGRQVILLADYTKIGVESLVQVAPVQSVSRVITNAGISSHDRSALAQLGIDVVIADA